MDRPDVRRHDDCGDYDSRINGSRHAAACRRFGILTMIWCFDRKFPHFFVRNYDKKIKLDIEAERWPGTIRFLGDENIEMSFLQTLWYQYRDVERKL